jgi:UDP-N-acetylglucosamine 1-carboxyvinyltransferase
MRWIEIESSGPARGTVKIQGSKNSSLALISACCLTDEPVILKQIPDLYDVRTITGIAADIGLSIDRLPQGELRVQADRVTHAELDPAKTSAFRASYYFVGALLARFGRVSIGYPGGDDFVHRPMEQHIKLFQALGAKVTFFEKYYVVEAERLQGADIYFDVITSGATINALLAASLAEGKTILRNAAKDPEVVDTANLLNQMGAKIIGAGTDHIEIRGVKALSGCTYTVIPDRLIAGTMLMVAGITGGEVTVEDVVPEHLGSCLSKLEEIGLRLEVGTDRITAYGKSKYRATRVRTGMYPSFATDLQQPITGLLLKAEGRSLVADKVYPYRFSHVPQLIKMGADIRVRTNGVAVIEGGKPLRGAIVQATDVRAGALLIMAGMMAEGTTYITGVEHIERGFDQAIEVFSGLGVNIAKKEGSGLFLAEMGKISSQ